MFGCECVMKGKNSMMNREEYQHIEEHGAMNPLP